jgi:hypothetical protein
MLLVLCMGNQENGELFQARRLQVSEDHLPVSAVSVQVLVVCVWALLQCHGWVEARWWWGFCRLIISEELLQKCMLISHCHWQDCLGQDDADAESGFLTALIYFWVDVQPFQLLDLMQMFYLQHSGGLFGVTPQDLTAHPGMWKYLHPRYMWAPKLQCVVSAQ